jgi:putative chitinase
MNGLRLVLVFIAWSGASASPSLLGVHADRPPGPTRFSYTVEAGDTLSSIALATAAGLDVIRRFNPGLDFAHLKPGQVIKLPHAIGRKRSKMSHQVQEGETLTGVARAKGVPADALRLANPAIGDKPTPGTVLQLPVTATILVEVVPELALDKAERIVPHLNQALAEARVNTPERKAAFLAQMAHESGNFKYMEEIKDGSAYEGRADLGNTQAGDGKRFKGRGFIQVTGRKNYTQAAKDLDLDLVNSPEDAATEGNAARIAAWYWNMTGLNELADVGKFDQITKRINGGLNGKADRDKIHARARKVWGLPPSGSRDADMVGS